MPKSLIVGATGLVGKTLIEILFDKKYLTSPELYLIASEQSRGKLVVLPDGTAKTILTFSDLYNIDVNIDVVFLCTSSKIVKSFWPLLKALYPNAYFIDNSSYFRMAPNVSIIVPPVNRDQISYSRRLYVNSNCVVAGLVVYLDGLRKCLPGKLRQIRVTSYQSVSGSGYNGMNQLENERKGDKEDKPFYGTEIFNNVIPQIGSVDEETGFTDEETKIMQETQKILADPSLDITATCVRCPVDRGHSLSVEVTSSQYLPEHIIARLTELLPKLQTGLVVSRDHIRHLDVAKTPLVYVRRLRVNPINRNHLLAFLTLDNLYRGASYNSYEIAASLPPLPLMKRQRSLSVKSV